ncbi:MAG: hypothetical protein R3E31_25025 [Chloroflexota bacterium]
MQADLEVANMFPQTLSRSFDQLLDKSVLYTLNRRVSDSLERTYRDSLSFAEVLAQTQVNERKTAVYQLSAPGEHPVYLDTPTGEIRCHVRVRLTADPHAPLLLYHHGINELPYTSSWWRIFNRTQFPVHNVCVQAPYHDSWMAPFAEGFASLQNIYQMFAGSLRLMELVQTHFEAHGSPYTLLAGVSWGGMTSMLYEGLFQNTRAVVPMLSSPDLAQVIWDIAHMFKRPIPLPLPLMKQYLDFTPIFRRCDPQKVFPVMGENDLFFRMDNHADIFEDAGLQTIATGHITGLWQPLPLRQHLSSVLQSLGMGS